MQLNEKVEQTRHNFIDWYFNAKEIKSEIEKETGTNIKPFTEGIKRDEYGDPVPRHFEFTGRIIFISNLAQSTLDAAVKSRSFVSDITMTQEQMFKRIEQLQDEMETHIPANIKKKALRIMKELSKKYDGVEINLRSFIKASRICAMGFANSEAMVAEQIIKA